MLSMPTGLPPEVARAFARNMRAFFFAGRNTIKADEIPARQLHALRTCHGSRQLGDLKEMFAQMRNHF